MKAPGLAWRFAFAGMLILALSAVTAIRLAQLQLLDNGFLKNQGDRAVVRTEKLPAHRGLIFDRNHEVLAASTPVDFIWAQPSLVDITASNMQRLAACLDRQPEFLRRTLARNLRREFIYLKRRVSLDASLCVEQLDLPGIYSRTEYRRYYPAGEVAAHVVGLTNIDDVGQEGAELAFNDQLSGVPGSKKVLRDRHGRNIQDLEYIQEPHVGEELTLSLDLRLQYIAYRELQRAVHAHEAKSGSIILLDAVTGEVLALVNQPSYNPNSAVRNFDSMRNRALTDVFEPGSTVKPLIVAAAIDDQRYAPTSVIDTNPGYVEIAGKRIKDPINYGVISLKTLIAKSSQVGMALLSQRLGADYIFSTLMRFGLGQPTGLELPGEAIGALPDWPAMSKIGKVTMAYGYGMTVTSTQLAQAYFAFTNKGITRPLSILKQQKYQATSHSVVSSKTARSILEMLEGVTGHSGTATGADNPLYRIAGKTGTVRKASGGGYDRNRHIALFAGIAPASNPRLVGVVVINEPKGQFRGGGRVAAPVFSTVAVSALRLMNVSPDRNDRVML